MLYIALGILGAIVMPHNLYLHSSIVQTRKYGDTDADRASAIRFATLDSTVALSSALFINAAILIVAAATFHGTGYDHIADITDAYLMLSPLLGTTMASALFALALLFAGQNATITGTLSGPIVMEGFIALRLRLVAELRAGGFEADWRCSSAIPRRKSLARRAPSAWICSPWRRTGTSCSPISCTARR